MKKILLPLLLMTFIITSCSKDPISSINGESGDGKISLTFNKSSIPSEIVKIKASLTRANFEEISETIIIGQDSIISIDINNVPSGDWRLEVLAYDQSEVVKYRGSKDVIIMNDYTSEVYLTLDPAGETSQGYGNIKIYIKWGDGNLNQSGWIKKTILTNFYSNHIMPAIIKDGDIYKMWIAKYGNDAYTEIDYSTSTDGLNWSIPRTVLKPKFGTWYEGAIGGPTILKENDKYTLYFTGFTNWTYSWNLGAAVSEDGINWIVNEQPIMSAPYGDRYIPSSIINKDNVYKLYMIHSDLPSQYIKIAESINGHSFTLRNVPLILPTYDWEGSGVYNPSVVYYNNLFHMIYTDVNSTAFGYATSTDGVNWEKTPQPIYKLENEPNAIQICYPKLVTVNNQLWIYYNYQTQNSSGFKLGILSKS